MAGAERPLLICWFMLHVLHFMDAGRGVVDRPSTRNIVKETADTFR